jgi:hypothetical protein
MDTFLKAALRIANQSIVRRDETVHIMVRVSRFIETLDCPTEEIFLNASKPHPVNSRSSSDPSNSTPRAFPPSIDRFHRRQRPLRDTPQRVSTRTRSGRTASPIGRRRYGSSSSEPTVCDRSCALSLSLSSSKPSRRFPRWHISAVSSPPSKLFCARLFCQVTNYLTKSQ